MIIGHAPEMIDGNRSREPLTALFHTMSLGEVSVDAFFLLSGFLITQSMAQEITFLRYLERRLIRIYPAFIVAYLLSVFLLGGLLNAHPASFWAPTFVRMVFLREPMSYPGF